MTPEQYEQKIGEQEARITELEAENASLNAAYSDMTDISICLAAVIEAVRGVLPGPRTWAESLVRDFAGNPFPRSVDAEKVERILASADSGAVLSEHDAKVWDEAAESVAAVLDVQHGVPNPYRVEGRA